MGCIAVAIPPQKNDDTVPCSLYVSSVEFIADLHIHSYLSRATAKNLNLENLHLWAQLKGIAVVGTGDFTHPHWFSEIAEKLKPVEEGLFALKTEYAAETAGQVPSPCRGDVRFVLSVEISSIYKKDGKTRKVHNLVLVPTLDDARRLNEKLADIGNIGSDGRPILGLDSKVLLEIVLDTAPEAMFIPAHIWTPWFSVLGSKSGFDSLDACFEDLTEEIFAVETGLSSDPSMNWRVSSLDRFSLVSNSDAHSPANLGREANLFNTEKTYPAIRRALQKGDPHLFLGTVEYFAEEGKYHFDGHRKCGIRLGPRDTQKNKGLCPVCQKPLTIGVMHRVEELADRETGRRPAQKPGYTSLLPLTEVLSEILQVGPKTKKVGLAYHHLLNTIGPEFHILRHASFDALERHGPALLAEGICRMREGNVTIAPGFDGEFGTISLFSKTERAQLLGQKRLFSASEKKIGKGQKALFEAGHGNSSEAASDGGQGTVRLSAHGLAAPSGIGKRRASIGDLRRGDEDTAHRSWLRLNDAQRAAVQHVGGSLLVVAGPGTGKTRTLTVRIAHLIHERIAAPEQVLAVTFTNKAAAEMAKRLDRLLNDRTISQRLTIRTFHGLCLDILTWEAGILGLQTPIHVIGEADRLDCVKKALKDVSGSKKGGQKYGDAISMAKQGLFGPDDDLTSLSPPRAMVISPGHQGPPPFIRL